MTLDLNALRSIGENEPAFAGAIGSEQPPG